MARPNTGSPDRTGAGSPLRVRCATRRTPQSPFGGQACALIKTVRTGGTPGRTGCRQAAGCPLRCAPGMLREGCCAKPLATAARFQKWRDNRGESPTRPCGPPSPFSSKMERESPPLPQPPSYPPGMLREGCFAKPNR